MDSNYFWLHTTMSRGHCFSNLKHSCVPDNRLTEHVEHQNLTLVLGLILRIKRNDSCRLWGWGVVSLSPLFKPSSKSPILWPLLLRPCYSGPVQVTQLPFSFLKILLPSRSHFTGAGSRAGLSSVGTFPPDHRS